MLRLALKLTDIGGLRRTEVVRGGEVCRPSCCRLIWKCWSYLSESIAILIWRECFLVEMTILIRDTLVGVLHVVQRYLVMTVGLS